MLTPISRVFQTIIDNCDGNETVNEAIERWDANDTEEGEQPEQLAPEGWRFAG